jgi:hypothetical protein
VSGMYTDYSSLTPSVLVRPPNRKLLPWDIGPSTGSGWESANAAAEKDNPWLSSYELAFGRKLKGSLGAESLDRGTGAGLFPEARPRGTTPTSREPLYRRRRPGGLRRYCCTPGCQETQGIMLPLVSSPLAPDYDERTLGIASARERTTVTCRRMKPVCDERERIPLPTRDATMTMMQYIRRVARD